MSPAISEVVFLTQPVGGPLIFEAVEESFAPVPLRRRVRMREEKFARF